MKAAKWEAILENRIEGFFNRCFSGNLEWVEVFKQLEREMEKEKRISTEGTVVPNDYTVFLNEEDYQRLCAQRFRDAMHEMVERQVIRQDHYMDGELQLHLQKSSVVKKGICEVQASFLENPLKSLEEQHTLVLERKHFNAPLNLPHEYKIAVLTASEGLETESFLEFGEKQIYLGRLDKNDFILTDTNVSRMHAYITYERHRHVLYDAGSTNGTFLNGKKICSECLRSGDEIRMGQTVLLYEVI